MRMRHRHMPMRMHVRFRAVPGEVMPVLVMLVVHVFMCVFEWLVRVLVLVMFGQMQPDAGSHQRGSDPEWQAGYFTQEQQ